MPATMPIFYDTHAHLDDPSFRTDLPQVLERAAGTGITKVVSIGTNLEGSLRAVALADQYDGVFAAVGWHPSHAHEAPEDIRPALRDLARRPKVVALGETGLDYRWLPSRTGDGSAADDDLHKRKQASLFRQHLEVAVETGLNLVIHHRESFDDIVSQFRPCAGEVRAVFHCFGENADRLRQVLDLGCLVSFTGIVSFKNAHAVRETVAATPPGSFMLETDSPYLAPLPYRGKRCEPAYVKEISELVAQVRGCSREELSQMTCATARSFFHKLKTA